MSAPEKSENQRDLSSKEAPIEGVERHDIRTHPVSRGRVHVVCFTKGCAWEGSGIVTPQEARAAATQHAIRTTRQVYS